VAARNSRSHGRLYEPCMIRSVQCLSAQNAPGRRVTMNENAASKPLAGPTKFGSVDVEAFSKNLARMIEDGGKALAAYLKPREEGKTESGPSDEIADMSRRSAWCWNTGCRTQRAMDCNRGSASLPRTLGTAARPALRRRIPAGHEPEPGTSASPIRSGRRPVLRFLSRPISLGRTGPEPRLPTPKARSAHAAEGGVLRETARQRACRRQISC